MKKEAAKNSIMEYLFNNYVNLTPITLKEIAAAIKETSDEKILEFLEELKKENRISVLESMSSVYGTEVIMQLGET